MHFSYEKKSSWLQANIYEDTVKDALTHSNCDLSDNEAVQLHVFVWPFHPTTYHLLWRSRALCR